MKAIKSDKITTNTKEEMVDEINHWLFYGTYVSNTSTKIALRFCFGRFLKTYFWLKEITYFIVKESGGKYLKENWEKYRPITGVY